MVYAHHQRLPSTRKQVQARAYRCLSRVETLRGFVILDVLKSARINACEIKRYDGLAML